MVKWQESYHRPALILIVNFFIGNCEGKYAEGEIHTYEDWVFIARFCFLSEDGQFEYLIEYNEEQGAPNLLLYYDDDDQWPAVYKSDKLCKERETMLKPDQNQLIQLTPKYRKSSGCVVSPQVPTTTHPKYTLIVPTMSTKPATTTTAAQNNTTTTTTTTKFNETDISTTIQSEDSSPSTFTTSPGTVIMSSLPSTTIEFNASTPSAPIKKRAIARGAYYQRSNRNIICKNARRFRSARERWWFIAISNCGGKGKGIHIKYKILMTNGPAGDYWHEHFSADEFYVLPVLMAFSVAYSFLILAIVICSIELKSRQLLHSTYKLFVLSVLVQFFGILFRSLSFLKYAVNGVGSPKLKLFGAIFMGMSETCYLLLLLLLAKGYTVTRGRLPLAAGIKLTIFMCLYAVTYISLFIYEAKVFDPGEVLYTYESPAGYGLIVLRILAWFMFIYSTIFTLKHYPEKANFYYPFNVLGTLWYIAGPAFIISANTYIDKWVRESVVCAVLLFITFGGHLMFLLLTMPSVANKNFPYHVRTTQIGVMEITGTAGNSSIEQFGHHVYEPTSGGLEQTVIVPLSRRTEEIFGGLYSQHLHTTLGRRSDEIDGRTVRNGNDMIMENVLSWSVAKNFSTLEVAHFDKVTRNNLESAGGARIEEIVDDSSLPTIQTGDVPQRTSQGDLNEYIREVPVELFTISKMVVTKTTAPPARHVDDVD